MEKQTRVNKYKTLRDEMKEEVTIHRHTSVVEDENEDDDFLSFLPKEEKPRINDTLMEPLSYETLKQNDDDVKMVLNEAKVNVRKEQYNTRLDILNKIKKDESGYAPAHGQRVDHIEKDETLDGPQKKMSLLEKLAAMSPEEDAEELRKFEEGMTVADLMSSQKANRRVKEEKVKKGKVKEETAKYKAVKEEPKVNKSKAEEIPIEAEEKESKLVTILNYVIIVFIFIFLILAFFILKQLLF